MTNRALDGNRAWMLPTYIVEREAIGSRRLVLTGDEGRHAARAARARPGELVRLIDGHGIEAAARVLDAKNGLDLEIVERREHDRSEGVELVIGQALLKGRGFDEPARRLAELGVARVVPLLTERVVPRLDPDAVCERATRWRSVAASATKQSRGVFLTELATPATLEEFVGATRDADARLVAWEEGGGSLRGVLDGIRAPASVACVVGPEGGLTAGEVEALERAGFVTVSLGRRILRADWAAAAVAAHVSLEVGGLLP